MTDDKLKQKVVEELDKVNAVWQDLLVNVHSEDNKPRITTILVQVMIEYYIDRTLILKSVIRKSDDINRFDLKLEELKKLSILNDNDVIDFLIFYKIRNIYAHEITIREKQIHNLINSNKSMGSLEEHKTTNEKLEVFTQIILRKTQRMFMDELVREQEHSKSEIDLSFLHYTLLNSEP